MKHQPELSEQATPATHRRAVLAALLWLVFLAAAPWLLRLRRRAGRWQPSLPSLPTFGRWLSELVDQTRPTAPEGAGARWRSRLAVLALVVAVPWLAASAAGSGQRRWLLDLSGLAPHLPPVVAGALTRVDREGVSAVMLSPRTDVELVLNHWQRAWDALPPLLGAGEVVLHRQGRQPGLKGLYVFPEGLEPPLDRPTGLVTLGSGLELPLHAADHAVQRRRGERSAGRRRAGAGRDFGQPDPGSAPPAGADPLRGRGPVPRRRHPPRLPRGAVGGAGRRALRRCSPGADRGRRPVLEPAPALDRRRARRLPGPASSAFPSRGGRPRRHSPPSASRISPRAAWASSPAARSGACASPAPCSGSP